MDNHVIEKDDFKNGTIERELASCIDSMHIKRLSVVLYFPFIDSHFEVYRDGIVKEYSIFYYAVDDYNKKWSD